MQFFIEIKGSDRKDMEENKWKEDLLLSLEKMEENLSVENVNYKIIGLPFYTDKNKDVLNEITGKDF
jgi:hypothetical protein